MGDQIRKLFDGVPFDGVVTSLDEEEKTGAKLFHVTYSDGDSEDLTYEEIENLVLKKGTFSLSLTHTYTHIIRTHTGNVVPQLKVDEYIALRERAISLFKHYPVVDIKIKRKRGK